jgi:hypothetical protein
MKDAVEIVRMVMQLFNQVQFVLVIGPILGLLVIGFIVSLRSGDVSLSSPQGVRNFLGNLSRVVIRVCGYLAGLVAVQQLVGFPIGLGW